MPKMKNIAVTMRARTHAEYNEKYNAISYDLVNFLKFLDYNIFLLPININPILFLNKIKIDGIILGPGENTKLNLKNNCIKGSVRDLYEFKVIKFAIKKEIPLLGMCRGMQILNLFFGGKIRKIKNHVTKKHQINSACCGRTSNLAEM